MNGNISSLLDSAAGKAQKAQGESLRTFLASLTTSGIILGSGVMVYTFLKSKFTEYYQRTNWISDSEWKPFAVSPRMLFLPTPDPLLKHSSRFDNYLFDRYLNTVTRIFLLLGLTVPPILIPLNVVDGKNEAGGVKGLDRLSFSNVGLSHTNRYWVHLVVALLVVALVCDTIQLELRDYTRIQKSLGLSDLDNSSSLLIVSKPNQQLSVEEIRRRFHKTAGGIHAITVNRNYSSLRDKIRRRDGLIRKLETAETSFIMKAFSKKELHQTTQDKGHGNSHSRSLWTKYMDEKDRPSMRLPAFQWLPSLPFVGPQVDMISHFCAELARSNLEIEWDQKNLSKFPSTNSAFVHFNQRISTQLVELVLKARIPPSWTIKHGTAPNDTIWHNISIKGWEQWIRIAIVYLLATVLTLGFAFPVAIIGLLSQIEYLANVVSWLQWIGKLPSWLVGVVQGVLPPAMLLVLTALVPATLRLLVSIQGLYSRQATENQVQVYYFAFQFVQGFLTISLSAGITTVLGELTHTIQAVPAVLAQNLPKACNYFFSYFIMHTCTTIVSTLLQLDTLVSMCVLSPIFDKTARQKWMRVQGLSLQEWGTFVPALTNIACIGLIYSVIAPLILVFSALCFGAFWILYRFYPPKLTEPNTVMSGLFYPTAIRQLFTGVYFLELCLVGLFFLVRDADGRATCTAQAIIMIIATILTSLFHYSLDHGFFGLSLPTTFNMGAKRHEQLSMAKPRIFQAGPSQDKALNCSAPVLWIPKDELGISDNDIYHIKRTYDSIWISNEGAFIDGQGRLMLEGPPPDLR